MKATKKTATKASAAKAPWNKDAPPAKGGHTTLSPQQKAAASRAAKKAGRPYPNLVDNMAAARRAKSRAGD